MKILSFTHPEVVPNLYECLCSALHTGRYSEECGKQSSSGAPLTCIVFYFPTMEVEGALKQPGYKLFSKYFPLCSAEQRNSCRFWTTWGRVNDDRISIFGGTIPLNWVGLHQLIDEIDYENHRQRFSLSICRVRPQCTSNFSRLLKL